jgi:hypothetical protein
MNKMKKKNTEIAEKDDNLKTKPKREGYCRETALACVSDKMSTLAASKSAGDHGVSISAAEAEVLKSARVLDADAVRESASGWGGSESERERMWGGG